MLLSLLNYQKLSIRNLRGVPRRIRVDPLPQHRWQARPPACFHQQKILEMTSSNFPLFHNSHHLQEESATLMIHLPQMVCKKATVLGTQPLGYLEPGTFLRKKRTCGCHQVRKETPHSGGPAEASQSRWGFPFSVFSVVFTGCRPFRICYKARIQHAVSKPISLYKDMGDCLAFLGIRDKEE